MSGNGDTKNHIARHCEKAARPTKQSSSSQMTLDCFATLAMTIMLFVLFITPAHAQCTNPAGNEAGLVFNEDAKVLQYCDGANWKPMGYIPTSDTDLTTGLVGHWRFEDGSGSGTAADSSANTNTGTLTNMVPASDWVNGRIEGGALRFDGTDDMVDVGNDSSIELQYPMSLTAWVNIDQLPSVVGDQFAIMARDNSGTNRQFEWRISTNDRHGFTAYPQGISTGQTGCGTNTNQQDFTASDIGKWVFVGITIDATGYCRFYKDDEFEVDGPATEFIGDLSIPVVTSNTTIGNDQADRYEFQGRIDDVRFYNRELTGSEMRALYHMGGPAADDTTNGLVGHWKLDETTGTTAIDYASANNGTMTGGLDAATDSVDGRVNTALNFDGTGDYIDTPPQVTSLMASEWSLSTWFKFNTTGLDQTIYSEGRNAATDYFTLNVNSTNQLTFGLNGNPVGANATSGETILQPDTWYHGVITKTTGDDCYIYINGVFDNNSNLPNNCVRDPLGIDRAAIGTLRRSSNNEFFNGTIDDLRIYDRVLSTDEIEQLYRMRDGHVTYDADARVPKFFNGDQWVPMGPVKPTDEGLVGHWKLDDSSGAIVDSSGNGYDGSQAGGITYDVQGIIGTGIEFDGVDDVVSFPAAATTGATEFTAALWVKTTESLASGIYTNRPALMGNETCCSDSNDFIIQTNGGNVAYFHGLSTTGDKIFVSGVSINDDQWHHVAVTYTSAQTDLYVDGAFVPGSTLFASGSALNSEPLVIGDWNDTGAVHPHDGTYDDVRFYNRALSAAEITDLYKMNPYAIDVTAGLVGHWRLDEETGTTAVNAANPGTLDLTLINTPADPWDESGGKIAGAITLAGDGSDDAAYYNDDAALNPTDLTIAAWFKVAALNGNGSQKIISKYDNPTSTTDYWMDFNQPQNSFRCGFEGPSTQNYIAENQSIEVPINQWHHGACVYDSAAGTWRAYLNGNLMEEIDDGGESLVDSNGRFYIGAINWGGSLGNPREEFGGEIDDARLYNRALSDAEIKALFRITGPCSTPERSGGTIIYNDDNDVMQYCDGDTWRQIGP